MGDLNADIGILDGPINRNGELLLNFAEGVRARTHNWDAEPTPNMNSPRSTFNCRFHKVRQHNWDREDRG